MPPKETKIAVFFYQTNNASNGGVVSLIYILNRFNPKNFLIFTNLKNERTKRLSDSGFDVFYIPMGISFKRIKTIPKALLEINSKLNKYNVKSIHANDITALQHVAFLAKYKKIPLYFTVRDVKEPHESYGFEWKASNWCQQIFVLSNNMGESLNQRLPLNAKKRLQNNFFKTIYSYVPLDKFKPLIAENKYLQRKQLWNHTHEAFHIIYVAAFMPKKNQLNLLVHLGSFLVKNRVHLHFIGDFKPEKDAYAAACNDYALQNNLTDFVHFVPFTPQIELYYQAADLAIVASKREGLARCMIEAMACGLPVISFDVASAHEMITERNAGMVVKQGDYVQMGKAILELLHAPQKRQLLGNNARIAIHEKCTTQLIDAEWANYLSLN